MPGPYTVDSPGAGTITSTPVAVLRRRAIRVIRIVGAKGGKRK